MIIDGSTHFKFLALEIKIYFNLKIKILRNCKYLKLPKNFLNRGKQSRLQAGTPKCTLEVYVASKLFQESIAGKTLTSFMRYPFLTRGLSKKKNTTKQNNRPKRNLSHPLETQHIMQQKLIQKPLTDSTSHFIGAVSLTYQFIR